MTCINGTMNRLLNYQLICFQMHASLTIQELNVINGVFKKFLVIIALLTIRLVS